MSIKVELDDRQMQEIIVSLTETNISLRTKIQDLERDCVVWRSREADHKFMIKELERDLELVRLREEALREEAEKKG